MSPKFAKSDSLFGLLSTQSAFLVQSADALAAVFSADPSDRRELNHKLHDVEHGADEACHTVLRMVNQSFILPFDREDLYALTSSIDDVVDLIDEAGDNIVLYKPLSLPKGVAEQIDLLKQCAKLTHDSIGKLSSINDTISEYWIGINELENRGDKLYRSMIGELFNGGTEALEVMKIKAVLDVLEDALDAFETLSGTVEAIAIKES